MSLIARVVVVDDYEPWRRHISSALEKTPRWQIVAALSNGLDAVQAARELQPDLVLLDVGLPMLNGIQAAGRIIAENPQARILFVSEHQSWDVAEAALCTGARGYVVKSDSGRELLPAMDAIAAGTRFIGARLAGRRVVETSDGWAPHEPHRHDVCFYSDERLLVEDYSRFADAALADGAGVIFLGTASRQDALHRRLRAGGGDVDGAVKQGRYVSLNAAESVLDFMVDGRLDEERFWKAATSLIMRAARASAGNRRPRVAACGECAPHLMREGHAAAAIRLEQLWDELARVYDLEVFCGYAMDGAGFTEGSDGFRQICAAHSAVHLR